MAAGQIYWANEAAPKGAAVFKSVKSVSVHRKRVVALARKSFTVPAGRKVSLRIRMSKKNFRILKRNRTIRTRATVKAQR